MHARRVRSPESDVEAKEDHVAIAHDILFSFNTKLACFTRFRKGTERNQIVVLNRVRRDEATLEIRMDRAGGRRRFLARVNGPGARFFFSGGEEGAQAEQMINRPNKRVHAAVFDAEAAQILHRFLLAKIDKFAFDLCADDHRFGREMMSCIIFDCIDMSRSPVAGVAEPGFGRLSRSVRAGVSDPGYSTDRSYSGDYEIGLGHVAGEEGRF